MCSLIRTGTASPKCLARTTTDFSLCLDGKASMQWHVKHDKGLGITKSCNNMSYLAKEHGIPLANIETTSKSHIEMRRLVVVK